MQESAFSMISTKKPYCGAKTYTNGFMISTRIALAMLLCSYPVTIEIRYGLHMSGVPDRSARYENAAMPTSCLYASMIHLCQALQRPSHTYEPIEGPNASAPLFARRSGCQRHWGSEPTYNKRVASHLLTGAHNICH